MRRRSGWAERLVKYRFWRGPVAGLLALIVAAAGFLTLAGFLGRWGWWLDLASHFRAQYLLVLAVAAMGLLLLRQTKLALAGVLLAAINLFLLLPLYWQPASALAAGEPLRLLSANVLQSNNSYAAVSRLIEQSDVDLVVLIETNQDWIDALQPALAGYAYQQMALREDNYGLAVFSRLPFDQAQVMDLGPAGVPTIAAQVRYREQTFTVIGAHPPPPKGAQNSALRNAQLAETAAFIRSQAGPVLMCGDLNLSPWSPYFREVSQTAGLHNSAQGFGLQPTWPSDHPWLLIPIDHCLGTSEIHFIHREVGPAIGSDHFPILVDFSLQARP